jgi:hypothetical protein
MTVNGRGLRDRARVRHSRPPPILDACKISAAASPRYRTSEPPHGSRREPHAELPRDRSGRRCQGACCQAEHTTAMALACHGSANGRRLSGGVGDPSGRGLLTIQRVVSPGGHASCLFIILAYFRLKALQWPVVCLLSINLHSFAPLCFCAKFRCKKLVPSHPSHLQPVLEF